MNEVNGLDDNELYSEINEHLTFTEKYFGLSLFKAIFVVVLVVLSGLYISLLLFGDNSLNVLFDLEEYEQYLSGEVSRLKNENATLQKEYFELLELNSQ